MLFPQHYAVSTHADIIIHSLNSYLMSTYHIQDTGHVANSKQERESFMSSGAHNVIGKKKTLSE